MKKYVSLLFFLCAGLLTGVAQNFNIPVFRGELAEKYNYPMIGTIYAYSDEFEEGYLYFNGKKYDGLLMNLNAYRSELYVKIGEIGECISLKNDLVGDFSIGKRNYSSFYGERQIEGLPLGYYQVLFSGRDTLLKSIIKTSHDVMDNNKGGIVKEFRTRVKYWLIKDGRVIVLRREKDLAGIYQEKKSEIRLFMKNIVSSAQERDNNFYAIMSLVENGR